MVVETAAHRSRIFTATWPWSNGHGGHLGIGGSGTEEHHDPYCQVTIRMISGTSAGGARGASSAAEGLSTTRPDTAVFSEVILVRGYNSLSLAEDGQYVLELTDCYGHLPGHAMGAATTEVAASDSDNRGEETRLSFLPLPRSLKFDIGNTAPGEGVIIGTFHLLPIVQAPCARENTCGKLLRDDETPSHQRSADWESARIVSGGAFKFILGAAIGVVFTFLVLAAWWVAVFKGQSMGVLKECMSQGWRYTGRGGRQQIERKKGKHQVEDLLASTDGNEMSDTSSSDGDLGGNVPDPVGLPRSEEDWRILFDTLYQQEQEEAKAAAAVAANSCTSTAIPTGSSELSTGGAADVSLLGET